MIFMMMMTMKCTLYIDGLNPLPCVISPSSSLHYFYSTSTYLLRLTLIYKVQGREGGKRTTLKGEIIPRRVLRRFID